MADGFEFLYVITAFLSTNQAIVVSKTGLVESNIDPSSFDEFFLLLELHLLHHPT